MKDSEAIENKESELLNQDGSHTMRIFAKTTPPTRW